MAGGVFHTNCTESVSASLLCSTCIDPLPRRHKFPKTSVTKYNLPNHKVSNQFKNYNGV